MLFKRERERQSDSHLLYCSGLSVFNSVNVLLQCYKQPKIPDSYAPRRCYMKPSAPVESCTTYKLSYLPVDGCKNLRGEARKPSPNLVPSCEPMESCTVQKVWWFFTDVSLNYILIFDQPFAMY